MRLAKDARRSSVAKISVVRIFGAGRKIDEADSGRRVQVAALCGRGDPPVRALVLPLRHQLSGSRGDDGRTWRRRRPHDGVSLDAALRAGTREALGLVPQPAVVLLAGR